MNRLKKLGLPLLAPLISLFFYISGNAFFNTFISLHLKEKDYTQLEIGGIVSIYYLGMMAGSFFKNCWINRVGYAKSLLVTAMISTVFYFLIFLSENIYWWYFCRLLIGIAVGIFFIALESWVILSGPEDQKGETLSIYMIALYSSITVGQYMIKETTISRFTPYIIAAFLTFSSIFPLFFAKNGFIPDAKEGASISWKELLKGAPLGILGNLLAGLSLSAIYGLLPLYGEWLHLSISDIGLLMAITIAGGFLGQWPLGRISDLFDKDSVLKWVIFCIPLFSLPLILGNALPFMVILGFAFIIGVLNFTLYPIAINSCCEKFPHHMTLSIVTYALIVYGIGSVSGPLIAAPFMASLGNQYLFLYFAIVPLFFLALAFLLNQKKSNNQ